MAKTDKPNILILWGDDIGIWNISHFSRGMMGYQTPNIDRIAKEGVTFTDYYSQQSCTAGRACFICGQNPIRTGLTKVGMPGATVGLQKEDPTIAEMLKPLGYATGQFGKNHLGDRDEYLPTVHGFDEFFGNLYHLNAEEEPELPDYPKDPAFKKQFGPRGVLHCKADGKGGQSIVRHRSAHQEAHGNDRRGDHGKGPRLDGDAGQGGQAVLPLVQLDGHAFPHARGRQEYRQERPGPVQRSHGRP
jgi:arylsulfatase A-like enzyme